MFLDKRTAAPTRGSVDKALCEIIEPPVRQTEDRTVVRPPSSVVCPPTSRSALPDSDQYHADLTAALAGSDEEVHRLIEAEYQRQQNTLQLIAAENQCSRAVLAALGCIVQNKTTEGFAGRRFHGGCAVVDCLENLAVARAKEVFGACYANVQPHSGTGANQIVILALLEAGDRILSLGMDQGGHVSHGDRVAFAGKYFQVEHYGVDRSSFLINYDAIRRQALRFRPKLIICGASAYSRIIDFAEFRRIADEVGAYLLADISHISGLVAAGVHPSPIDCAHFTTTSTYKPGGPRGGLILMGKDYEQPLRIDDCGLRISRGAEFAIRNSQSAIRTMPLWERIEKTIFPGFQGTPHLNNVAAKAVFFKEMLSPQYRDRQFKIVENARSLAAELGALGYDILTGGTDNHLLCIDVTHFRQGLTGAIAQKALEECGIIVNMNRLPYDPHSARVTSGVRLGTPIVTRNGMGPAQMETISQAFHDVLRHVEIVGDRVETQNLASLPDGFREQTLDQVRDLCAEFPMH